MFSLLDNIIPIVVTVFFISLIQCSTSGSLENDKLVQLIERLERIQTKMDSMRSREAELVVENAQLTERLDKIQTKMDAENAQLIERLDRMQTKIDAENDKWTRKFADLEAENEKLKSLVSHPKFSLSAARKLDDGQSIRVLSSPPTSCQELKNQNGLWPMDGIHLLKKQNKIKAAFCTFAADGSPVSEVLIGQVDIQTKSVHFYALKNSGFGANAVIPFEIARLNEGNSFDLLSGIFTVPVKGIYHFDFSALKTSTTIHLSIFLQVNGVNLGAAHNNHYATGTHYSISLSASFRLAVGDRVNLINANSGALYDDDRHFTHFSGWLVEEDLM